MELQLELRVKEIAKSKGVTLQALSKKLGISYQALDARTKGNTSLALIQEMAIALECNPLELIKAPAGYGHFYVEGEWHGIRKL